MSSPTDYYKSGASDYKASSDAIHDSRIANIVDSIESLGLGNKAKILDIGCGDSLLKSLIPRHDWTGLDINPSLVGGNVIQHDITSIPYPCPDSHFDVVVCSEVLEHLFNPLDVVKEIRRVVKPEGRAIITVPNLNNIDYQIMGYGAIVYHPDNIGSVEHIRQFTPNALVPLIENQGFRLKAITGNSPHLTHFFQQARSVLKVKYPHWTSVHIDQLIGEMFPLVCPGFMAVFEVNNGKT